jgi:hypothetical protein
MHELNLFVLPFLPFGDQKIVVFIGWSLGVGLQTVHWVKAASLPGYGKMPL